MSSSLFSSFLLSLSSSFLVKFLITTFRPHNDVPHSDVPHNNIFHNEVPHNGGPHNDVPHKDVPYNDVPHNDVPHNDVFHNDVPHNDVLHILIVLGHYHLVLIGIEWYWVDKGLLCLYILKKINGDVDRPTDRPTNQPTNRVNIEQSAFSNVRK